MTSLLFNNRFVCEMLSLRLSLPEDWRGLRDNVLSEKAGIPDCVFVHASGFIGGNQTYEGALAMARKALLPKSG